MSQQLSLLAFVFPGQGSQKIGMGQELAAEYAVARQVFEQADEILGMPLTRLAWEGPEEELNDTINTQPALLVHSVAALRVIQERFPQLRPSFVAGHSMGQLSALVACGALGYADALKLARRRGELMKEAGTISPGGMAAVLGLDIPTLEQITSQASVPGEAVQVANDNCPGQVVISGAIPALERAMALAQAGGARKVTRLAVSIAAHSALMAHAQDGFNQAVAQANLAPPATALVGNVRATALHTISDIRSELQAQLTSRVRWTESMRFLIDSGISIFVEVGSGSVLTSLLKRIDREPSGIAIGAPEDLQKLDGLFSNGV